MAEPSDDGPVRVSGGTPSAEQTTGASLLRGGAWTIVAFVLPQLFTLVLSVAAARYLGPRDMGRQSYIAFLSATVGLCLTLGLPLAVQRHVASSLGENRPGQARVLASWATRRAVVSAAVALVVVASMRFLTYPELGTAWLLAGMVSAVAILHGLAAQVLFALQRFRLATVYGLAAGLFTLVTTITVLSLGYGITAFFAAELAGGVLSLLGTGLAVRRVVRRLPRDPALSRDLRGDVLRFAGLSSIGLLIDVVLFRRSEFFFLQAFSEDREIAVYSIAFAAVAAASRLTEAVVAVVLPAVSTLAGAGHGTRIAAGYVRAMRLMTLLAMPVAALSMTLGPLAVRIAYGEQYERVGTVLVVLAPVPLLLGPLAGVASATLNGLGKLVPPLVFAGAGLVVNLALDLALIPRWDAVGAALANGGGQLVSGLLLLRYTSRHIEVSWVGPLLVRGAAAAAAAGAVGAGWAAAAGVLGDPVALLLGLVSGLGAFVLVARALGALAPDDGDLLRRALGPRLTRLGQALGRAGGRR